MGRFGLAFSLLLAIHADAFAARADASEIDRALGKEWRTAKVKPAPLVDDATFLRRVELDITGRLPTPEQVTAFLADANRDKRTQLVDKLLATDDYAEHFADYWEKVLLGRGPTAPVVDRGAFHAYLRTQFARNTPWDALTAQLVAGSGVNVADAPESNGAVNYFLRYVQNRQDLAGRTARVFLGVQVQCAQCHNHPTEKWTQADFLNFTAAFVNAGIVPLDKLDGSAKRVMVRDFPRAHLFGPAKMELPNASELTPTALDGTVLDPKDRRQSLVRWMVRAENPWFAPALVNRVWGYFLGRGFVEPLDDFRQSNPAVAPALLATLASEFQKSGYDLKALIRTICTSQAYQRGTPPVTGKTMNAARLERVWARHPLRPLEPDQLLDALDSATHYEALMARYVKADINKLKENLHRLVTFVFNVDEDADVGAEGTITQALTLLNGAIVSNTALAVPGSVLAEILASEPSDPEVVTALYLRCLSRPPTAAELHDASAFVGETRDVTSDTTPPLNAKVTGKAGKNFRDPAQRLRKAPLAMRGPKVQAFEDLFWALLNSSEFYYRH